jgi:alcohol dehydrogenase (cytochrome c)
MAFDGGTNYYIDRDVEYEPGLPYLGGFGFPFPEGEEFPQRDHVSAVRALDPLTGQRKWEYRVQVKSTSGLISTAGNLLFGGTKGGQFFALDARTGEELWRLDLGGTVHAAPITYSVDGEQFVTIAAGSAFFTLGL